MLLMLRHELRRLNFTAEMAAAVWEQSSSARLQTICNMLPKQCVDTASRCLHIEPYDSARNLADLAVLRLHMLCDEISWCTAGSNVRRVCCESPVRTSSKVRSCSSTGSSSNSGCSSRVSQCSCPAVMLASNAQTCSMRCCCLLSEQP